MVFLFLQLIFLEPALANDESDLASVRLKIDQFERELHQSSTVKQTEEKISKNFYLAHRNPIIATPENCTDIDNRTPALAQVRNQQGTTWDDGVNWCYAFTAADLLSVRLGIAVSAMDIALFFQQTKAGKEYAQDIYKRKNIGVDDFFKVGASTAEAIFATGQRGGVCPEEQVHSDTLFGKMDTVDFTKFDFENLIHRVYLSLNFINDPKSTDFAKCFEEDKVRNMFPTAPTWQLTAVEQILTKTQTLEWLDGRVPSLV